MWVHLLFIVMLALGGFSPPIDSLMQFFKVRTANATQYNYTMESFDENKNSIESFASSFCYMHITHMYMCYRTINV